MPTPLERREAAHATLRAELKRVIPAPIAQRTAVGYDAIRKVIGSTDPVALASMGQVAFQDACMAKVNLMTDVDIQVAASCNGTGNRNALNSLFASLHLPITQAATTGVMP